MINASEEIEKIMEKKNVSKSHLAKEMGMSRQSLNQYMTRKPESLRLDVLQSALDVLGYELAIVEKPGE